MAEGITRRLLQDAVSIRDEIELLSQANTQSENFKRNESVKGLLDAFTKKLSEHREEAEDIRDEVERSRRLRELSVHERELESFRVQVRAANLKSLVNQKKNEKQMRQELLAGEPRRHDDSWKERSELEASKAVNSTIVRLWNNMSGLTSRGDTMNQRLAETSKIITDVIDEHDEIESELKTAKKLTRNLRMREFADRILLGLAVLLYVSVCLYIILARLKLPISAIFSYIFSSTPLPPIARPSYQNENDKPEM